MHNIKVLFLMLVTLVSCCLNVVFLEFIIKEYSPSHHLITLSQYLFITLCTLSKERFKPKVPIKEYINLVVLYFLVTLSGNYALVFNISMPLHMIFKSGSLIANMMLSILILKRKYNFKKYLSVFVITLGIILCTFASSKQFKNSINLEKDEEAYTYWLLGIFLLIFSIISSAQTGIFQEKMTLKYGRNTDENLFYCHVTFLPGFLFVMPSILTSINYFNASDPVTLFNYNCKFPKLWFYLLINILSQYFCSKSVFILSNYCTSLTITFLLTLRKFFSLIISIYIFKNAFTLQHWIGTFFVFSGTFFFAEVDFFSILGIFKNRNKKEN